MISDAMVEAAALALANRDCKAFDMPLLKSAEDFRFTHDRDDYFSMARAAIEAAFAQMWRPIGEAPRNGTYVLTAYPEGYVFRDRFPSQGFLRWEEQEDREPTHYMPIPQPPEVTT